MRKQKTIVYVDGFNLYYGCLKNRDYKWLDLKSLFMNILDASHEIVSIKYFTAPISSRGGNNDSRLRQKIYLKAIEAFIPELKIYHGHYLTHPVKAKVVSPPPEFIQVYKTEEKGSDVNLALHILNDAWLKAYDCAVLVSNDSDLAESLKMVKEQHKCNIGLIFPNTEPKRRPSHQLTQHADFVKRIRNGALAKAQLPEKIPGTEITKPVAWY